MSLRVRLTIFAAVAISIGLFALTEIPLGIPGEWTWNRIEYSGEAWLTLSAVLLAMTVFAVFVLVAWAGANRVATASRTELAGWLLALTIAGFFWLHAVQDTPTSGLNSAKLPFILYYPSSSGYFYKASYEVDDTSAFLRDYEETVRHGDTLHEGTHPPGLVVLFRGLIWFAELAPEAAALPQIVLPESGREAFEFIRSVAARPLTSRDQSVLWLAAMLTQVAAVLVVVPLFFLLRLTLNREAAWRAICFWPLVPAVAVFLPKSDVLFALGSSLLVCLWVYAVRAATSSSGETPKLQPVKALLLGSLAGAVGWLGLFCSLAFLPAGAIAVAASVLLFREPTQADSDSPALSKTKTHLLWSARLHRWPLAGGVLSFVFLTALMAVAWDLNLLCVWQLNYANHARFYEVSSRSYFGWLMINPLELALAIGAPLAVLLVCGLRSAEPREDNLPFNIRSLFDTTFAAPVAVGLVWGLLWLTGKNSGEAARLWVPLMPLALWAGGSIWQSDESTSGGKANADPQSQSTRDWLIVLSVQAVVCLATVLLVTGFGKEQSGLE